jgi:Spy/CpxP family protein refolding chaperone
MNRFVLRSLALGVFALVVTSVIAQRPQPGGPGGFGGQMGIAQLVTNKSVQEELKLTEDQIAKFKTASDEVRTKFKADLDKARESKDFKAMGDVMKSMNEESSKVMTKLMDDTLKPDQVKRIKQIELQVAGTRALASNAEVQKTLKLSESQIGEIKAINEEAQKDKQELFKSAGMDREKFKEVQAKSKEIDKDASEKSISKLSPEQKKQWIDMTGPKFELKMGGPMRPGME